MYILGTGYVPLGKVLIAWFCAPKVSIYDFAEKNIIYFEISYKGQMKRLFEKN